MRFLADEGVDLPIVRRLRAEGHDVLYVLEMEPGIGDDEVLRLANQENALLITADKDFGELVFRQQRVSLGVVLLRLAGLSSSLKAEVTALAIREHTTILPGAFAVITPDTIRIRQW